MTETTVTKTCDLCGKKVKEFYKEIWQRNDRSMHPSPIPSKVELSLQKRLEHEHFDLCEECNNALISWLEQRKTK